jgi:Family of unknown function (DUF6011)
MWPGEAPAALTKEGHTVSDPFDFLDGLDDQLDEPADWDHPVVPVSNAEARRSERLTAALGHLDTFASERARDEKTRREQAWMDARNPREFDVQASWRKQTNAANRHVDPADEAFTPPAPGATFREECRKCAGRGRFIGWNGRDFGNCFACKGVGHFDRKTSPEVRAHARAATVARKERNMNEARESFAADHSVEWAWLKAQKPTFDFAQSMLNAIDQWGSLTERQLAAVQRLIERDTQLVVENAARAMSAPAVATDKLMAAFDAAVAKGVKRPKMRFETFTASLAPATGKNPGAVYLKADGDLYLGKIVAGRFHASRDASEEAQAAVVEAMADPLAAAVAFGRKTGACSICGRELTDPVSVAAGIGPICEGRFGL